MEFAPLQSFVRVAEQGIGATGARRTGLALSEPIMMRLLHAGPFFFAFE
jgi:hypothetical protein